MKKSRSEAPLIKTATAINLRDYVEEHYKTYIDFGRALNPPRKYSATGKILRLNYAVIDDKWAYSYRQNLTGNVTKTSPPEIAIETAIDIERYIDANYESLRDFGQSLHRPMLTADVKLIIQKRYIVINDCLYSYRFDLPKLMQKKNK